MTTQPGRRRPYIPSVQMGKFAGTEMEDLEAFVEDSIVACPSSCHKMEISSDVQLGKTDFDCK
jgi:hypothetical protein